MKAQGRIIAVIVAAVVVGCWAVLIEQQPSTTGVTGICYFMCGPVVKLDSLPRSMRAGTKVIVTVAPTTPTPPDTSVITPPTPPNGSVLASANFDDGTYGGLTNEEAPGHNSIIPDPSNSGHGKVLQVQYDCRSSCSTADLNQFSEWKPSAKGTILTHGSTICFNGDVYFPADTRRFTDDKVLRKLIYWRTNAPGGHQLDLVLGSGGTNANKYGLSISGGGTGDGYNSFGTFTLTAGVWAHIQIFLQMNSAPGVKDGSVTVWVNSKQTDKATNLAFTRRVDPASTRLDWLTVGHQREGAPGDVTILEYHDWDNIVYSKTC